MPTNKRKRIFIPAIDFSTGIFFSILGYHGWELVLCDCLRIIATRARHAACIVRLYSCTPTGNPLLIMWELQGWRFVRVNLIFYFFLSPVFLFINEMVSAVNVDLI